MGAHCLYSDARRSYTYHSFFCQSPGRQTFLRYCALALYGWFGSVRTILESAGADHLPYHPGHWRRFPLSGCDYYALSRIPTEPAWTRQRHLCYSSSFSACRRSNARRLYRDLRGLAVDLLHQCPDRYPWRYPGYLPLARRKRRRALKLRCYRICTGGGRTRGTPLRSLRCQYRRLEFSESAGFPAWRHSRSSSLRHRRTHTNPQGKASSGRSATLCQSAFPDEQYCQHVDHVRLLWGTVHFPRLPAKSTRPERLPVGTAIAATGFRVDCQRLNRGAYSGQSWCARGGHSWPAHPGFHALAIHISYARYSIRMAPVDVCPARNRPWPDHPALECLGSL